MSSSITKKIYIPLLDEGTTVSRPTEGELLGANRYRVLATPNYDPDVEKWEFPPGSIVVCDVEIRGDDQFLVARRVAEDMRTQIQELFKGTLAEQLGIRFIDVSKEKVVAEMTVKPSLFTSNGRLHGGAIMALADTVGATGAFLTIPEGASGTTTIESKTNFFRAVSAGVVRAEALPVHVGKRTSCWQTRVTDADGKLVAQVTQTQMVLTS